MITNFIHHAREDFLKIISSFENLVHCLTGLVLIVTLALINPATAQPGTPGQPQFETLSIENDEAELEISWASSSGSVDYYNYNGGRSSGGGAFSGTAGTNEAVVDGFDLDTNYWICVSAVNGDGEGSSACNNYDVPDSNPPGNTGQPQFSESDVQSTHADMLAEWDEPTSGGDAAYYTYEGGRQSGGGAYSGQVSTNEATITGLDLDTNYWFCVRAFNEYNEEGGSSCNNFDTPDYVSEPPDSPGKPQFDEQDVGSSGSDVLAEWTAPAGGGAVDHYSYTGGRQAGGGGFSDTTSEPDVLLADLDLNTQYWFCVRAVNSEGESSNNCNNFTTSPFGGGGIAECENPDPAWIWCDDFEENRLSDYFEEDMTRESGVGLDGSTGASATFTTSSSGAGSLKAAFGRTPSGSFTPVDDGTEDYREVYWRQYVKHPSGWVGNGADKLSRAMVLAGSNWEQAMIAHVWSGSDPGDGSSSGANYLRSDPVSGTNSSGTLQTTQYNDWDNLNWLGSVQGTTPLFSDANKGEWHCVEARAKLNDGGSSNGVFELWVNGDLNISQTNLNYLGHYDDYGINAVFFENYWNSVSPVEQTRYFDNIVISTERIGCVTEPSASVGSAGSELEEASVKGSVAPGDIPEDYSLNQNYPNPFNPTTQISYALPEVSAVRIDVYDVVGRRVATLVDGTQSAGTHTVTFDATHLTSGVYLYVLQTGNTRITNQMLLMK